MFDSGMQVISTVVVIILKFPFILNFLPNMQTYMCNEFHQHWQSESEFHSKLIRGGSQKLDIITDYTLNLSICTTSLNYYSISFNDVLRASQQI